MITERKITENTKLDEWLNYWFETYSKRFVKQSTAISYQGYITNHIIPQIGCYSLSELNIDVLQCFFNYELDNGSKRGGGLSAKTLSNMRLMLHEALEKAVEMDIIRKNWTEFIVLPRIDEPEMRVLTEKEYNKLLTILRITDEKLAFGVYLSVSFGLRLGEVLGLRWCDVDTEKKTLHIKRTVNRLKTLDGDKKTEIVVGTPKSKKSVRDIPFNEKVKHELIRYYNHIYETNCRKPSDEDYIVTWADGHKPCEPKSLQTAFKRILKQADIQDANFHSLRHTFATRAIEKGVDVKTLSVLLGHSSVGITLNRYVHILDEQKRKTMELILDN